MGETILMVFTTLYTIPMRNVYYSTTVYLIRSILSHFPITTIIKINKYTHLDCLLMIHVVIFTLRRWHSTRSNGTEIGFGRSAKALVCCRIDSESCVDSRGWHNIIISSWTHFHESSDANVLENSKAWTNCVWDENGGEK